MKFKELMMTSLNKMLQPGETLMHPIYGILHIGNDQHFGFFAFTQTDILVAMVQGSRVVNDFRVPLNVTSVRIRKSALSRQHTIDISFAQGAPMKITAYGKVLTIDTQKENLPRFLDRLQGLSGGKETASLRTVEGEKIRMQYFNVIIFGVLLLLPIFPTTFFIMGLRDSSLNLQSLGEMFMTFSSSLLILLVPLGLLSLLNRFLFGKVVAAVTEQGLAVENRCIPWKDIREVTYTPEFSSRHKTRYTFATLHIAPAGEDAFTMDVLHFPIYGFKHIRKAVPEIRIQLSNRGKHNILILLLTPIIAGIVAGLIK